MDDWHKGKWKNMDKGVRRIETGDGVGGGPCPGHQTGDLGLVQGGFERADPASELKTCVVLVTPTSYGAHDPRLRTELESAVGRVIYNTSGRPLTSEELQALLPECHGYIAGLDQIDRTAIEKAHRLKVIARYGVGVDNVDLAAAAERGIVVTNTPHANAVSVAELTVGLMLALARSIPMLDARTKAGEWPRTLGVTLQGKTVGLIGLGAVGREVAARLRCFRCILLAYDPFVGEEVAAGLGVRLLALDEVVGRADFLSLHLPLLPGTRGMVNRQFLSRMKPGSYLINTARGELVDEGALVEALESGHLRGAALDCFGTEPPDAHNPLLSMPQVIATPHCGAHTDGAADAMGWMALRDCLAVLRGEPPVHPVVFEVKGGA
jgi:D-3-phosphoglycerate dehydrogenase